jgi:hypothetical protein
MSKLLRMPLVLLIALAMAVLWTWPATADPVLPTAEECLADPTLTGCLPAEQPPAPDEPTDGDTGSGDGQDGTAGGGDGIAGGDETPEEPAPNESAGTDTAGQGYTPGGWVDGRAGRSTTSDTSPSATDKEATEEEEAEEEEEEPAAETPEECLQRVGEEFAAALEALGTEAETLATAFAAAVGALDPLDPTAPAKLEALLTGLGEDAEELGTQAADLFAAAGEDVAACLALPAPEEPPATGGGNKPPANNPPSGVQGTYYENCDDARAKGAAPVYSTQPGYRAGLDGDNDGIGCEDETAYAVTPATAQTYQTGQLAYTGIELEPMLRGIAILISSGTLLLLAGARRRV